MNLDLFDFVDELSADIEANKHEAYESVGSDFVGVTFCENFFDQFFATLGRNISGFGVRAMAAASELVEQLRAGSPTESSHEREIISLYEEFCDIYQQIRISAYGGTAYDLVEFNDYLLRLLEAAATWALKNGQKDLADRIGSSSARFTEALANS